MVVRPRGTNLDDKSVRDIGILKIIEHSGYKFPAVYNDIAILELVEEAP